MSTVAEIVTRATALFDGVTALVESALAIELPSVIAELGAAGAAASITEELSGVIASIREQLHVVTALGQLGALFGLLEPLVSGLHGIFADTGRHLAHIGLHGALPVTEQLAGGFRYLQDAAALGASLALAPGQLHGLGNTADAVIEALDGLASQFRDAEEAAAGG
jgi:hypothetical protein